MQWIFEIVFEIVKDCETPEEAEMKVKKWGESVHPRDAACALFMLWFIEGKWKNENRKNT